MKLFAESFHWLDSNVFIQAKNGPYGFEFAQGFWTWLEKVTKDGLVRSPISVYNELAKGKDQLSRWAAKMKSRGLFESPDRSVQRFFGDIASFVQSNYEHPYAAKFLEGADPWVIAHAGDGQGTVVTHEILAAGKDVKIPNICEHFGVSCIEPYAAFRKLGLKL
jgi:hypothetical protein